MKPSVVKELKRLIGNDRVTDGKGALKEYFRNSAPPGLVLARPGDHYALTDIAALAYENDLPVFSVKRKYVDDGAVPDKKGILVDLSDLNQIKKIDTENLTAHVYAGVTFDQLQRELSKENQRLLFPVAGKSDSVLRSYMDRDLLMGSGVYRHPHISIFHAALASGEVWVSGSQQMTDEGHADFREDQGPQFSPFFGASEDIFGIPYYGLVYTYPNREARRVLAFGFEDVGPAKDLLYKANRAEWCFESFAANDRYLSVLLADADARNVSGLKKKLNPWTAVLSVEHHKELVDLWEGYIKDAAKELGGKALRGQVPEMLEDSLGKPWNVHDRDFYKGGCLDLSCYQYFKNVPDTFELVDESVASAGLKPDELGKIVVPVYFGGAAYCEADIYYEADAEASGNADDARMKAYQGLIDDGAFIDKPVGGVAEMVYSKTDPSYVEMIKLFKRTVDPRGLMNPDQLIKGV